MTYREKIQELAKKLKVFMMMQNGSGTQLQWKSKNIGTRSGAFFMMQTNHSGSSIIHYLKVGPVSMFKKINYESLQPDIQNCLADHH